MIRRYPLGDSRRGKEEKNGRADRGENIHKYIIHANTLITLKNLSSWLVGSTVSRRVDNYGSGVPVEQIWALYGPGHILHFD